MKRLHSATIHVNPCLLSVGASEQSSSEVFAADIEEEAIFSCMIHNLFDEYHFFPRYPARELEITAILFGK